MSPTVVMFVQWKDNLPHGDGVMITPGVCVYRGAWVDGLRHGQARVEYENGMLRTVIACCYGLCSIGMRNSGFECVTSHYRICGVHASVRLQLSVCVLCVSSSRA